MHYPKTVKRCNLELNPKEKRGSKFCPINYIKTLPMASLNHFLKNIRKKKFNSIISCEFLASKEVDFSNYWPDIEKTQITFLSSIKGTAVITESTEKLKQILFKN